MFWEKMVSLGNRTRFSRVAPNSWDLFDWATQPWLVSKLMRIEKITLDVLIFFSFGVHLTTVPHFIFVFNGAAKCWWNQNWTKSWDVTQKNKNNRKGKTVSPCRRIRRRRMRLQSPDRKSGHHDRFRWLQTPSGVMQVWRRRWPFLFAKRFVA